MIRMTLLTILGGACLALAFYVGMNKSLCNRIDTFSASEQEAMKLSPTECAKPWYAKL